jgi:excisionase family DNA binding protein
MARRVTKRKNVFTTQEVADLLEVCSVTVAKWFDTGLLDGYRLPGTKFRRIPRSKLIEFAEARNMPLPEDILNPPSEDAENPES